MAEKKQYHLIINHLRVLSKKDAKQYAAEMMNCPYSEDRGWGYSDVIRIGKVISATLQKRIPTYYSIWNEESQILERQLVQIVKEIPFEMDFQRGLLLAEGSNAQLNHVKQSFRQVFWNEFVYEPIDLTPYDYVSMFIESSWLESIDELTINDFKYEDCLIGRYIAKPTSQLDVKNRLAENAQRIIKAKMTLCISEEKAKVIVNNRNVVTLEATEETEEKLVNYLKSKI